MSFEVKLSPGFLKDVKTLLKKYRSLKSDLEVLITSLEANPTQGDALGRSCYKVRLAIKSKGKGKSGGAGVITYVVIDDAEVILLAIYDKQVKADLKPNELDQLLSDIDL